MAFAIFYDDSDLQVIQKSSQDLSITITQADRNLALRYWNGGLKNWQSAPFAQSPFEELMVGNTARLIVISGPNLSLLDFRNLLYRIAADNSSASYLKSLADDMGRNCGGVEPWPV